MTNWDGLARFNDLVEYYVKVFSGKRASPPRLLPCDDTERYHSEAKYQATVRLRVRTEREVERREAALDWADAWHERAAQVGVSAPRGRARPGVQS